MPPLTSIARKALEHLGGPRVVTAAIPGGAKRLAEAAGVSQGRVSQVLRQNPLPRRWADLIAELTGCSVREVYEQLEQEPRGSMFGPLFDSTEEGAGSAKVD
jgi:hypothetical protein